MSIQDDLTGLFNRKAFLHRLEHAISYCNRYHTKCAVMFVDLDGFKPINDALGHACGDELILQAANRIQSIVRDSDILARVGGDEFMVLLTHVNHPNDAARVAIKINRALHPPFEINNNKYHITASIGIAIYPNDSSEANKLIQYADCAMSMVKKRGKNDYQYYKSDLNVEAEKMMRISNDLRLAIESNQLQLYFHPQLCAKSGELVGLEALLRWNHPELGMVPPTLFIPIAEEMGFIGNIGQWVLIKACESYLSWQEQGLTDFTVSVNLSIKELQSEYFVERIAQCIEHYPIDPKRLQFEITESIFANDAQAIIDKLHQLKSMGFQIAMDDFGTGYSCLSYLKDLPIDVIKIDRSFVQCLTFQDSQRHRSIIAAIIDLAKRLDMTTLAEGVETEEQAEYLRSIGCEHFQGFLFAKPMPFEETTNYIRKILHNDDVNIKKKS
jgi:diguanylate cyclase (GGDEF)-like protein